MSAKRLKPTSQQWSGLLHARRFAAVFDVSQAVHGRREQRGVLADVLDALENRLDMQDGKVVLKGLDGADMVVARRPELATGAQGKPCRGEGISRRVRQNGRPVVIPRMSAHPGLSRCRRRGRAGQGEERSFLCVPITVQGQVIGTLSVTTPCDPSSSLEVEQQILLIVAGMIANDVSTRQVRLLERQALEAENARLRGQLGQRYQPENIIGDSAAMQRVFEQIQQVATSQTSVLLLGESGTGKELIAAAIHRASRRAEGPFVPVNCAALSMAALDLLKI
jgi:Nif-specific regulatory protein